MKVETPNRVFVPTRLLGKQPAERGRLYCTVLNCRLSYAGNELLMPRKLIVNTYFTFHPHR